MINRLTSAEKIPRGLEPESPRKLEDEPQRELQAARGISRIIGPTEKWGGCDAHEILVVDMIQSVEGIGCQFELLRVVIVTFHAEGFPEAQVKIGIARPITRIPSNAQWTVIEYGVPVVIQPGRNIERNSRAYSHNGSYSKTPRQIVRANEIELAAAIKVRSAPLGRQVGIISRQGKNSASIVHRTRKNILGVEAEIPTGVQAQSESHAVAARRTGGLELIQIENGGIRPHRCPREGRVDVSHAVEMDAAHRR